jgi:endonuclease-8
MPEGDTLHNAALRLGEALTGKVIARAAGTARAMVSPRLVGKRVTSVTARGKYLTVHFDDGRALVVHLRMTGAWHVYRAGERWRRGAHLARVILAVDADPERDSPAFTAVCFAAPVVRLVTEAEGERQLASLGPDVVTDEFDPVVAIVRLRERDAGLAIGEALLDQSALSGIGNVYKSETLFAERVNPFATVSELDDATLTRLVTRAHVLMKRNVGTHRLRDTTGPFATGRHAVYGRARLPCPRCGYPISRAYQGAVKRSTYFCVRCQRVPEVRGRDGGPSLRSRAG